jgi:hypothetical protein
VYIALAPGAVGGPSLEQLNEESMQAGNRKTEDGAELEDETFDDQVLEQPADEDDPKTGPKKIRFGGPSVAQTLKDTEVINNILKKSGRSAAASGAASSGQPRG